VPGDAKVSAEAAGPGIVLTQDHEGGVRVVTLNRPASRNAIDLELRVILAEVLEDAMADPSVGAVVLTGAGGSFCSGGDVSTMKRQGAQETRLRVQAVQRVVRAIWAGPKPVVAAVEAMPSGPAPRWHWRATASWPRRTRPSGWPSPGSASPGTWASSPRCRPGPE
jgi:1,4-dihydroxy-2-naphthoyl-CoA synthase